jgi:hypothetical protein
MGDQGADGRISKWVSDKKNVKVWTELNSLGIWSNGGYLSISLRAREISVSLGDKYEESCLLGC